MKQGKTLASSVLLLILMAAGCGSSTDSRLDTINSGDSGETDPGSYSITLAWAAPTVNEDGTPLTDLMGYNLYYGTSSGHYTKRIDVHDTTIYTINNLSPGLYYFAVTAYDIHGYESSYSSEASLQIP